jgi:hypothetical protein
MWKIRRPRTKFEWLNVLLIIFVLCSLAITWTRVRNPEVIPDAMVITIINGVVSATSMVVGFTGVIAVFIVTRMWDKLKLGSARPMIYFLLIGLPLLVLFALYNHFLTGEFDVALNVAISNLAFASALLLDLLAYSARETILHMRRNTIEPVKVEKAIS